MKSEFMLAINELCAERQLPREVIMDAIGAALVSAYRKDHGGEVRAWIDPETGQAHLYTAKTVVSEVGNPDAEISLEEARRIKPDAAIGDVVEQETTPKDFGRIAAQTAKQVIMQRIREAERNALYDEFADRKNEISSATVQSVGPHGVTLNLGRAEAIMPPSEQIRGEHLRPHNRVRVYVLGVKDTSRGPEIIVSRAHKDMLRRLLELEVPEIHSGAVEIKAIAREAGSRSKVAVAATQAGVDPVGCCVGMRGMRIQSIVNELGGEKIDVIEWSPDAATFIANALSPAKVLNVILEEREDGRTATVIVPDRQLSLAIGKEGQNARLAARLTGWRIDIKPASAAAVEAFRSIGLEEEPESEEDLLRAAEALLRGVPGPRESKSPEPRAGAGTEGEEESPADEA
ncbi:MAG: transcription termination/antitermination protein NusA [Anaerolineae bacterium]|nr:transcription termination/antitermination protein NusA [Anaerolineae bacterium]